MNRDEAGNVARAAGALMLWSVDPAETLVAMKHARYGNFARWLAGEVACRLRRSDHVDPFLRRALEWQIEQTCGVSPEKAAEAHVRYRKLVRSEDLQQGDITTEGAEVCIVTDWFRDGDHLPRICVLETVGIPADTDGWEREQQPVDPYKDW